MKQIESAVRQDDRFARVPPFGNPLPEFLPV
jgi:hypothetical protein